MGISFGSESQHVIQSLFVVIAVVGLLAALGTVLARNLVHAALYLVAFFFIIACLFVMLEAEFLAAIQVLVYIGAVAILMIFGIMLTRNVQGDDTTTIPKGLIWPALATTLALFFILVFGVNNQIGLRGRGDWSGLTRRPSALTEPGQPPSLRARVVNDMGKGVGDELLTRYAVAFEVAGLLLTAALVGAVALAHRDDEDDVLARRESSAARGARSGTGGVSHGNGQVAASTGSPSHAGPERSAP